MTSEFNFIHKRLPDTDRELFFGASHCDDSFTEIDDSTTMADILAAADVFQSKTQARKNLQDISIPAGFSDKYYSKKTKRVTILNYFPQWEVVGVVWLI